jgi:hypothetical protein
MIDKTADQVKNLWQEQKVEAICMSIEELRGRARKFQSTIRWRNLREFGAGIAALAIFAPYLFLAGNPIVRTGAGLSMVGILYTVWQLHRKGSAQPVPAEMGLTNYIEFHRSELRKQYDLLRRVWFWYLIPLLPGLAVFLAGNAMAVDSRVWGIAVFGFGAAVVGAVFARIARLNARAASAMRREIDALDVLQMQG